MGAGAFRPDSVEKQLTLAISPLHPAEESGLPLSSARPGWARAGAPDAVPVIPLTCCLAVSCNHSPPHL